MSDLRECVSGNTDVALADGTRVPIRSLLGRTPTVIAMSDSGRLVAAIADKVWSVGQRAVFDVRLAGGRSIRATARHRLYTAAGWQTLSELECGTRLAVAPNLSAATLAANDARFAPPLLVAAGHRRLPALAAPSIGTDGAQLSWDRVVSIEPGGFEEVFDLTVPGPASWIANGIVSHNSGAIEQDADVILLIYREEVYEPNTTRKGIADIIIAKQRNGPTGEVHLTFMGEYTRFENLVAESYGEGVFR